MTDKELADAVVALGVGKRLFPDPKMDWYQIWDWDAGSARFVRDWRVAGSLMEKCGEGAFVRSGFGWVACAPTTGWSENEHESLPRAIIEACVEALT